MKFIKLNPFVTQFEAVNCDKVITVDSSELHRIMALSTEWHAYSSETYRIVRVYCGGGDSKITLSRFLLNLPKESKLEVDHISGKRLDNRLCNLRVCSHQNNMFNIGLKSSNTSGYIGVHWNTEKGKWCARIRVDGKKKHLGYFESASSAAKAYDKVAKETRGEFAVVNFPNKH